MTKYVYTFGGKTAEGNASMKNELGGKGANLAEMCLLKLPVPAGLTITTECCTAYYQNNCQLPAGLMDEVHAGMKNMENIMGMKYGDHREPAARQLPFWRAQINARHDGHRIEYRSLLQDHPWPDQEDQQPSFRV